MEETPHEVIEISLEKKIETELVKANVTQAVINTLKDRYSGMKLASLTDKESYLELKAAAKECSKIRNLAVKCCKAGREDAIAIQKLWVAKEKEVVAEIQSVETPLDNEIAKFDAEVERLANEEKRLQEEAYMHRTQALTKMGAVYSEGSFTLGAYSIEAGMIKESSDTTWNDSILPKFDAEYQTIEAERIELQKKKDIEEAELKRKQDELAEQQRLFNEQQAEFKRKQDEQAQVERDRIAEEQRLKVDADNKRWRYRLSLLDEIGWNGQFAFPRLADNETKVFTYDELVELSDETFGSRMKEYNSQVVELKKSLEAKAEEKRLSELKVAEEQAALKERQRIEEEQRLNEVKRQQEEQRKAEELAKAGDTAQWDNFLEQVKKITVPAVKSGQYRKISAIAKEKLEEILTLKP